METQPLVNHVGFAVTDAAIKRASNPASACGFLISVRLVSGGAALLVWLTCATFCLCTTVSAQDFENFTTLALSTDGTVATVNINSIVDLWDFRSGFLRTMPPGRDRGGPGGARCVTWSRDGRVLAVGYVESGVSLWDISAGKTLLHFGNSESEIDAIDWSPSGKQLATGNRTGTARMWDVETGKESQSLNGHGGPVSSIAWSPSGDRIATGSEDGDAKIWDIKSGKEVFTFHTRPDNAVTVAWRPNGKLLAVGGSDSQTKLWDTVTGKEMFTLPGLKAKAAVDVIAWSPDGKRLAVAYWEFKNPNWKKLSYPGLGMVEIWLVPQCRSSDPDCVLDRPPKLERTWAAHVDAVTGLAWSTDGRSIVTASDDGQLKLWDSATGKKLETLGQLYHERP